MTNSTLPGIQSIARSSFAPPSQPSPPRVQAFLDSLDGSSRLSQASRAELISLSRETNADLQGEGLYRWARRQEERGRPELAAQTFALLSESENPVALRAKERLLELQGGGRFAASFERHLRNFSAQSTDPITLAGMAVGSGAFSVARSLALTRLARFGGKSLAAAGIGLAAETPAFWLTTKGLNELHRPGSQDWALVHNAHELGSLALTLGILRSGGALTRQGLGRLHGIDPATGQALRFAGAAPLTHAILPRAAMLGGLYLSHGIQESLGWRPTQTPSARLLDSAVAVLQFEVGGHLSRRLLPGLTRWSRELENRSQRLESEVPLRASRPHLSEKWAAWGQNLGRGQQIPQGALLAMAPLGLVEGTNEILPTILLGLGVLAMTIGASRGSGEPLSRLPELMPSEFLDWVREGRDFYLVDIRETTEYAAQGQVSIRGTARNLRAPLPLDPEREDPTAKEYDLPAFADKFRALNLDPGIPVLFICRVGNRTNHEVVAGLRLLGLDLGTAEAPNFYSVGGGTYGLLSHAMVVARDPALRDRLRFEAGPDYFKHRGDLAKALSPFLDQLSREQAEPPQP